MNTMISRTAFLMIAALAAADAHAWASANRYGGSTSHS